MFVVLTCRRPVKYPFKVNAGSKTVGLPSPSDCILNSLVLPPPPTPAVKYVKTAAGIGHRNVFIRRLWRGAGPEETDVRSCHRAANAAHPHFYCDSSFALRVSVCERYLPNVPINIQRRLTGALWWRTQLFTLTLNLHFQCNMTMQTVHNTLISYLTLSLL